MKINCQRWNRPFVERTCFDKKKKKPEAVWSRHFRWDTNKVSHNEDEMVVKDLMWCWRSWQRRAAFMLPGKIQWSWIRIVRNHHFSSLCLFFFLFDILPATMPFACSPLGMENTLSNKVRAGLHWVLYAYTLQLQHWVSKVIPPQYYRTAVGFSDFTSFNFLMVALPFKVYAWFVRDLAKEFIFAEKSDYKI